VSHFFEDGPSAPGAHSPQRPVEFDALADLFLGDDDAPALRLASDEPAAKPEPVKPAPRAPERPAVPRKRVIEALVLGHLPVLAGAWAAQHARCLASEAERPVALARFTSDAATLQVMGQTDNLPDGECEMFDEACKAVGAIDPAWCVRVEAPSELDLAASPRVTRVTLLSGADEAAVVAAYRTLKGLCELSNPDDAPALAVRIMGASEEDAARAQEKITRVAKAFLDRQLVFLPPSQQISAGAGRNLYRGEREGTYDSFLATLPAPPAISEAAVETPREPVMAAKELGLAERIELKPLDIRCPASPDIEFARDDADRLHLLGLGAEAATDLLAAEGWARTNATLVLPAAGLTNEADIVVRVLTATPSRDRKLLDGRFRVDLLREVRVGDATAWCCVPLNADE